MADLSQNQKLIVAGVGALAVVGILGLRQYWDQRGPREDVGKPYNVEHTGHVGQYQVGPLLKTLEGKKEKNDYILTYFDIRGRAEPSRLIFHDTKTPFRDENPDNWREMKEQGTKDGSIPFGQLPQLKHGNLLLVESNAILRYLGRKLDRYGANEEQRSVVDMLLDNTESFRGKYLDLIYKDKVEAAAKEAYLTKASEILTNFENWLTRESKRKYFVGDELTIADASFWELLDAHLRLSPTILEKFPRLRGFYERVATRPNIAAYLASPARRQKINANGLGQ
jgi:glutathione S-transferase